MKYHTRLFVSDFPGSMYKTSSIYNNDCTGKGHISSSCGNENIKNHTLSTAWFCAASLFSSHN